VSEVRTGWRAYHLLGFVPTLGMLGGLAFVNRVHPLVLGMPLLFAWIAAWVLATSLVMWCILRLDRANERRMTGRATPAVDRAP
jgi:hypothetical protein